MNRMSDDYRVKEEDGVYKVVAPSGYVALKTPDKDLAEDQCFALNQARLLRLADGK